MVEEYGGVVQFSKLIAQMAADSFLHAEKARLRKWDRRTRAPRGFSDPCRSRSDQWDA
jgi:hypothetical protein